MKINKYLLPALLMLTGAFCACTYNNGIENVKEGEPAEITLSFATPLPEEKEVTRAAASTDDEQRVVRLYVFVFNANGSKAAGQYFYQGGPTGQVLNTTSISTGNITMKATSGTGKKIYAIANVETDATTSLFSLSKSTLDAINTEAELLALTPAMKDDRLTIFRIQGSFMMVGQLTGLTINSSNTGNNFTVQLERIVSRIKFSVKPGTGVKFVPNTWKVINVPKKTKLVKQTTDGSTETPADYFSSQEYNFETVTNTEISFEYYQQENRKEAKLPIPATGTAVERYKQRTERLKSGANPVTNGAFKYANDYTTYVVFSGNYTKTEASGDIIQAVATYTVPLGYTIAPEENDYKTERNVFYTYNITITGVNEIIVEAERTATTYPNGEKNPGVEGEVITAKGFADVDAHYETAVFKINRAYLQNANPENIFCYVNTPFDKRIGTTGGTTDVGWVTFRRNSVGSNVPQIYNPNPVSGSPLLTANEFIQELKDNINAPSGYFDGSGDVYYTVYINEFYYDTNPVTGQPVGYGQFVNCPPRTMTFQIGQRRSEDDNSIHIPAMYRIRQRAIETIYNPDNPSSPGAFGMESVNETGPLMYSSGVGNLTSANSSPERGRANSILYWGITPGTSTWNTYLEPSLTAITTGNWMKTTYNSPRYACMQRNRDINGNGIIDDDEVRWYLPSVNQLINTWIGTASFTPDIRLFNYATINTGDMIERNKYHMISSTLNPGSTSLTTKIWAEEGASTGAAESGRAQNYRCFRILGNVGPGASYEPIGAYTAATTTSPAYVSIEQYLDKVSFREVSEIILSGEETFHHHRQTQNRPYKAFYVAAADAGGAYNSLSLKNEIDAGNSPCKNYTEKGITGWRVPNQRELALMSLYVPMDTWTRSTYWSRTVWQFDQTREFAMQKINGGTAWLAWLNVSNGGPCYIRCVKDKP